MPSEHRLRLDDHWKSSKSLPKWPDTSKKQWCFSYNQDFHLCTHITRLFHLHVQPCFCNRQTADLWVQNCSGLVSLLHKTFFQNSTGLSRFIIAYSCLELFLYSALKCFSSFNWVILQAFDSKFKVFLSCPDQILYCAFFFNPSKVSLCSMFYETYGKDCQLCLWELSVSLFSFRLSDAIKLFTIFSSL